MVLLTYSIHGIYLKMIHVCEPQCKKGSHENFNSGFLYGLREKYGELTFYAENTHIQHIKYFFELRKIDYRKNISYININLLDNIYDFRQLIYYRKIFYNIIRKFSKNDKIIFLSINPMALFALFNISNKKKYKNIKFNIVLHGGIEDLYTHSKKVKPNKNNSNTSNYEKENFFLFFYLLIKYIWRIFRYSIPKFFSYTIPNKIYNYLNNLNKFLYNHKSFFKKNKDLSSFNFIVLSKHILNNLRIENITFRMKLLFLPCIFFPIINQNNNDYPKFALFGYGTDNGLFEEFLEELENLKPTKNYEIRLISSRGYSGIEKCNNLTQPIKTYIPRQEMEIMSEDIDYFLNFYDKYQYRLSCSGSIIESIMLRKPVIYIGNENYDSYNNLSGPIGIRTGNTQNFAKIVFNIIENWPSDQKNISIYKLNIEKVIKIIDINNQLKNNSNIFV